MFSKLRKGVRFLGNVKLNGNLNLAVNSVMHL